MPVTRETDRCTAFSPEPGVRRRPSTMLQRVRSRRRIPAARLAGLMVLSATGARAESRDEFYWIGEINKASTVMLVEQDIVPRDVATRIATAVTTVATAAGKPGAARPGDYLEIERLLIA